MLQCLHNAINELGEDACTNIDDIRRLFIVSGMPVQEPSFSLFVADLLNTSIVNEGPS